MNTGCPAQTPSHLPSRSPNPFTHRFINPRKKVKSTLNPQRNNNNNAIRSTLASTLVFGCAALSACGGGGGDSGGSSTEGANTNPLAAMQGTYVVACDGATHSSGSWSTQTTIVITAPAGGSEVDVSVHDKEYTGSADCAASTLDDDVTVTGRITSKGTTKAYTTATGKSVTAKVLTFTYSGLTISKGNFILPLPTFGTTTDIAYVLDGGNLYGAKGGRGADGLGDSLSARAGVKQ
jgi:hypothetical protein